MVLDREADGLRVFVAERFFDRAACGAIRAAMDRGIPEEAEILDAGIRIESDVRRATNVEIDDEVLARVEAAIDRWRDRAGVFHGLALTAREGASFLRYHAGGFYRPHRDRATTAAWPDAARRRIAVVVFLNDDFRGGELRLFAGDGEVQTIVPRAGTLVAFDARTLHEVLPVTTGTRDTIVDWFY